MTGAIIYVSSWPVVALIGGILICDIVSLILEIVTYSRHQKQLDGIEDMLTQLTGEKIIDDIKHGKGLPPLHDKGDKKC